MLERRSTMALMPCEPVADVPCCGCVPPTEGASAGVMWSCGCSAPSTWVCVPAAEMMSDRCQTGLSWMVPDHDWRNEVERLLLGHSARSHPLLNDPDF